jgi:hypothetical protein
MLADLQSSSFVILSAAAPAEFHYSSFVHIFIYSFSMGLTLWAERYKIPAQQQALSLYATLFRHRITV